MLQNLYENVQSCCLVGQERTDWFPVDVGVRQGCVLSPVLLNMFINGLCTAIEGHGLGVKIDEGNKLCVLMSADDICVIANSANELQKILDVIDSVYTRRCRFELNLKQTNVVVFGKKTMDDSVDVCYRGNRIEVKDSYTYLGVWFHCSGRWRNRKG